MRLQIVRRTAAVVFLGLLVINLGLLVVLGARARHDLGVVLDSRVRSALALVVVDGGRLGVEETPADEDVETGFWLFAPDGRVVASPGSATGLSATVRALAARGAGEATADDLKLRAVPAVFSGRTVGTVVVAVSRAGFTASLRTGLTAAVVLDIVILAGTVSLTSRTVTSALRPVEDMTDAAREWSERSLDRRFAVGSDRDEISHLGATLNVLLGRIGGLIRHEQAVTADIAHELKTPLTRVVTTADVALSFGNPRDRRDALAEIKAEAHRLARVVDELLITSAVTSAGRCDIVAVAREQAAVAGSPRGPAVTVHAPDALWVASDGAVCARALAPLIANAVKYARGSVELHVEAGVHTVDVRVVDDGPGFAPDEVVRVFDAGFCGAAAEPGHGLGLTLARRLARSSAGDVNVDAGPGGSVTLTLPA